MDNQEREIDKIKSTYYAKIKKGKGQILSTFVLGFQLLQYIFLFIINIT